MQAANSTTTGDPANSTTLPTPASRSASTRIGTVVGATVGSIVAATLVLLALFMYLRRRRRAREMPVNDDLDDDSGSDGATGKRSESVPGLILEPYSLATPVNNRTRSALEKGGSQQRVVLVQESYDNSSPSDLTSPADVVRASEVAPFTPTVLGDSDALHALERRLERRLDNLIQTLVIHGDTESNPPEYDGYDARGDALGAQP